MDNCIGKRNRRGFLLSLLIIATFFSMLSLLNAWELQENCKKPPKSLYKPLIYGVFAVVYALAAGFVGFLLVFHCYLVCSQKTTLEFLFKTYKTPRNNPFDEGCKENCEKFLCFCGESSQEKGVNAEFLQNLPRN